MSGLGNALLFGNLEAKIKLLSNRIFSVENSQSIVGKLQLAPPSPNLGLHLPNTIIFFYHFRSFA